MSSQIINLLSRLCTGVLNAINRKNKKDAADDPASTLSNGSDVLQSETSFADLADKARSDRVK